MAVFSFAVTVTFWSMALGGITYVAWDWALPDASTDPRNQDLLELVGLDSTPGRRIALYTALGIVFAVLVPFVVRGVALLRLPLGRVLLTSGRRRRPSWAGWPGAGTPPWRPRRSRCAAGAGIHDGPAASSG